jgi:allophanate hydrolase subunit 1
MNAAMTTVTLRALDGTPLDDTPVRDTVLATAHAIAERQGVAVLDASTTDSTITVTLQAGRIEAIGFAAELRRLTNAWYASKYHQQTLWGDVPKDHEQDWGAP